MENLFKGETYLISALDSKGTEAEAPWGGDLTGYLKRAALKAGFKINSSGACGKVGEFSMAADTPFAKVQSAMEEVTSATGLALFVSNNQDIVGKNLEYEPNLQRQAAFLRSGPSR